MLAIITSASLSWYIFTAVDRGLPTYTEQTLSANFFLYGTAVSPKGQPCKISLQSLSSTAEVWIMKYLLKGPAVILSHVRSDNQVSWRRMTSISSQIRARYDAIPILKP